MTSNELVCIMQKAACIESSSMKKSVAVCSEQVLVEGTFYHILDKRHLPPVSVTAVVVLPKTDLCFSLAL